MSEETMIDNYGSYNFYCLYELKIPGAIYPRPVIIRLLYPHISNNNLKGQDLAETIVENKRDEILSRILQEQKASWYRLVGYCECSPEGDDFYEETGKVWIDFWTFETKNYRPWMIFLQAADQEEAYGIIQEDCNEDWRNMEPICSPVKWHTWYVTEADYQISSESVKKQCVKWLTMAANSTVFTMNYQFYNAFLEDGWQFEQIYQYHDLLLDNPMKAFYEEKSSSWQGKLQVTFHPKKRHISFTSITNNLTYENVVEVGFDFSNIEELETIFVNITYFRKVLNYDLTGLLLRMLDEGIAAYWEVDGKSEEKIVMEKLPDHRYERIVPFEPTSGNTIRKVSLGIPSGYKVVWNTFCDIQPEFARKHPGNYEKYFTEDTLFIQKMDGSKSLDLGWSIDLDLSGKYQVCLKNNADEGEAYHEYQSDDILNIVEEIQMTLSLWKEKDEPEANSLVPLRIATGWEIHYNQWYKTGRQFGGSSGEEAPSQLLFQAEKHKVGCITVYYKDRQVPFYELKFQEDDMENRIIELEFHEEEELISVLEDWMEHAPNRLSFPG